MRAVGVFQFSENRIQGMEKDAFDPLALAAASLNHAHKIVNIYVPCLQRDAGLAVSVDGEANGWPPGTY